MMHAVSSSLALSHALVLADAGLPVIPLHCTVGAACSCSAAGRCRTPGKHPRTERGLLEASKDPTVIKTWFERWPDASLAVVMGWQSGLFAVDIDPRHEGDRRLAALEAEFGPLPETIEAATGGGGRHLLFRHPGQTQRIRSACIRTGIDIKGDGGYIVVEPSSHASGGTYRWVRSPLVCAPVDAPGWLLEMVLSPVRPVSDASQTPTGAAQHSVSAEEPIPEGGRNATLASLAGSMRRRGFGQGAIEAALIEENARRCRPPLPADEVRDIARKISRYAPAPAPHDDETASDARVGVAIDDDVPREFSGSTTDDGEDEERAAIRDEGNPRSAAAQDGGKARPVKRWVLITCPELLQPLPPVPWLVEGIDLAPGPCTMVAGYGYSGKTAACQALALAVATGTAAWGRYDVRQGRVLHIDFEQGRRLTIERYQRLVKGLTASGRYHADQMALVASSLAVAIMPPDVLDGRNSEAAFLRELEGYSLAVIDSYRAACPNTDENDSSARVPLDMLARVSEATGCTIVVIHHGRKDPPGGGGGGKQSMRGSSALFDAPQLVLQLTSEGAPSSRPGTNYALCSSTKARITGRAIKPFRLRFDDRDEHGSVNPESRFGLSVTAEDDSADDADAAIDAAADRVLAFVRTHAGCSSAEIKSGVKGEATIKVAAMDRLKRSGALQNRGGTGGPGGGASWFAPGGGKA